jgi:hypothetical protein
LPKEKAKVLTRKDFHKLATVSRNQFDDWKVEVRTPENVYFRTVGGKVPREKALLEFINVWYPVYLDDMGDYNV